MSANIELHGKSACPFFWKTRLVASEKGVPFDALRCDVPDPDPRVAAHNPGSRSPLLWQDGFALTESSIINVYLEEGFDGPSLLPDDARRRARLRLDLAELGGLPFDGRQALDDAGRARADAALRVLDGKLATGAPWLGGERVSLVDLEIWPWLALLTGKTALGADAFASLPRVAAYWQRVQARPSFRATNPYATV